MQPYATVSFLSDYGTSDEFAGVVSCVMVDIAPHIRIIDLTHQVPAFDVRAGSMVLARAVSYVPKGVVLAVVDPGVGSQRRGVAIEVAGGDGVFVGPDNGLLAPGVALAGGADRAVVLDNPAYQLTAPGATFAGRDVFGPAAAHLCAGVDLASLGTEISPDELTPGLVAVPTVDDDSATAEVVWVDRFGNAQLNAGPDDVPGGWPNTLAAQFGDPVGGLPRRRQLRRVNHFAELGSGEVGLVVDSYGMFAIVMDQRSAAEECVLIAGDQVVLTPGELSEGEPGFTASVHIGPRPDAS